MPRGRTCPTLKRNHAAPQTTPLLLTIGRQPDLSVVSFLLIISSMHGSVTSGANGQDSPLLFILPELLEPFRFVQVQSPKQPWPLAAPLFSAIQSVCQGTIIHPRYHLLLEAKGPKDGDSLDILSKHRDFTRDCGTFAVNNNSRVGERLADLVLALRLKRPSSRLDTQANRKAYRHILHWICIYFVSPCCLSKIPSVICKLSLGRIGDSNKK